MERAKGGILSCLLYWMFLSIAGDNSVDVTDGWKDGGFGIEQLTSNIE